MKKLISLVLCMFLICATCVAFADYNVGDTVTISVSVTNPNDAVAFDVYISFDSEVFKLISATGNSDNGVAGGPNGFVFVDFSLNPFPGGNIGTATFEVLPGAVPGKSYSISAYSGGAYDAADNEVEIYVSTSGGSVVVEPTACTNHNWNSGEVETEATCGAEGVMLYTCTNSGCSETKTEAIQKLTTHSYDNGEVTTKATCTEDGVKTYTCSVCKGTKTEAVPAEGHDDGEWVVVTEATCKADGTKELRCTKCDAVLETETIPAADVDHTPGEMTVTTEADCTNAGEKTQKCTVCDEVLATEEIPAEGHDDGEWVVVTEATCKADGTKELRCTKCDAVLETETIPAADVDHIPGEMTVTTEADCTNAGEKTQKCTVCDEVLATEEIPAKGHDAGEWTVVTKPTCTENGEKTQKCTVCDEVLATEEIPAEGHDDGEWVVVTEATCKKDGFEELRCTKCDAVLESKTITAADVEHIPGEMTVVTEATCTETGEKTQKCTVCDEVLATEEIPAEGHDEGQWVVVKPATKVETGLQELQCTKCNAVLDSAEIPVNTTGYYVRNTVCGIGPRFKDESDLTDKWYRFTPVDLSVDGVQTFELIGSDVNFIGRITVTVADGTVTIDCSYVSDEVKVYSEFCTMLPSLAEITTLDQAQLTNYAFGEPISIADDLGGDTKVLLFICNVVDYNTDMPITRMWPNTNDFILKINALKENMD